MTAPTHTAPLLAVLPPLEAYREDLASRPDGAAFGDADGRWLTVAVLLAQQDPVPSLDAAALHVTIAEWLRDDPGHTRARERDGTTAIVLDLVERMERAGALSLATSTAFALVQAREAIGADALEHGRALAMVAHIAWVRGMVDSAHGYYRRTSRLGRAEGLPELRVRAWLGYAILAHLRGNYPDMGRWARRAARGAERARLRALAIIAHQTAMSYGGLTNDVPRALRHGWRAHALAAPGTDVAKGTLVNVSELLREAGQPAAAAHGFRVVLDSAPAEWVELPARGGLARAAAALGDRDTVRACHRLLRARIEGPQRWFELANALLELDEALRMIGDDDDARWCREQVRTLSARHRFHALDFAVEDAERAAQASHRPVPPPPIEEPVVHRVASAVAALALV